MPWLAVLGGLALVGVALAAYDRWKRPLADFVPHTFTVIEPGKVPGQDYLIVPKGLVTRLPFISPRIWSAYLMGENLDAARAVAGNVETLLLGFPWLQLENRDNLTAPGDIPPIDMRAAVPKGFSNPAEAAKVLVFLKALTAAIKNGDPLTAKGISYGFAKCCRVGLRIKVASGYLMNMFVWPPISWTSSGHRDLWLRHMWAWFCQNYQAYTMLGISLSPDWVALMKEVVDAGEYGPEFHCPQHFGFKPILRSVLGVNDPSNMYVAACVVASACGFMPGAKFKCPIPGFTDGVAKKLSVVSPTFDARKPYMDQVQALTAGAVAGMKSPAAGAIVGAVGVVAAFFDKFGKSKPGNARSLWAPEFEPVVVPRSLLGAAGPANYLVTEADVSPFVPKELAAMEHFVPHTFKVIA